VSESLESRTLHELGECRRHCGRRLVLLALRAGRVQRRHQLRVHKAGGRRAAPERSADGGQIIAVGGAGVDAVEQDARTQPVLCRWRRLTVRVGRLGAGAQGLVRSGVGQHFGAKSRRVYSFPASFVFELFCLATARLSG
jgi:hypothetical protein